MFVAGGAGLWLTRPRTVAAAELETLTGDAARGEQVFWAAGCASCHAATGAEADDAPVLAGGERFVTAFGTFHAPNISPGPQGIGDWDARDLANAMLHGTSPGGSHYYPVFPYTSYAHATLQDVVDLKVFLDTLPVSDTPSEPHAVGFPFNIRASLGGWKLLFAGGDWAVTGDLTPAEERGRYLAEALGHCAECHTPRNAVGGTDRSRWLGGAPNPSGQGRIPNITPAALDWTEDEIAAYLGTGFTPDYDSAGGLMAEVVANLARLPDSDRAAIAAYLKRVPPVE